MLKISDINLLSKVTQMISKNPIKLLKKETKLFREVIVNFENESSTSVKKLSKVV